MSGHANEVARGDRFRFGANWQHFLESFDAHRLDRAKRSLQEMLGVTSLAGARFLDAGCGSGLFSLAAARLGADVHAFDYDPESVACARELRRRTMLPGDRWEVEEGSVLDRDYLGLLGHYDVVYSWGVLHHTGALWQAVENVSGLVAPAGRLYIAIYNDAGARSERWARVKSLYNRVEWLRPVLLAYGFARLRSGWVLRGLLAGHPVRVWRAYGDARRGMSAWHDLVDWVGGLPYEYADPQSVVDFLRPRGFDLRRLVTVGSGLGCNEFVLERRGQHGGPEET